MPAPVRQRPSHSRPLSVIANGIIRCTRCPELRRYCAQVAQRKRKAYLDCTYWGKPVPGFGDPKARIVIVGLAPAAHGGNRTGRVFTGDRSGDFLYAALHRAGLANQPRSIARDDGLTLRGVYVTAALRCAPPDNKPTTHQLSNCALHLDRELEIIQPRVVICLGGIAWKTMIDYFRRRKCALPIPVPRFAHGAEAGIGNMALLSCYHVSQQNTFTGRLTPPMIDSVLRRGKALADSAQ
jgi:uracil-DNA glycosylase